MEIIPKELFEGIDDDPEGIERTARLGRYMILQEMGFFGDETNIRLARKERAGSFIAQVRRHVSNTYGDTFGCSPGDIENAALYLDVFDDVFDVGASQTSKFVQDR